MPKLIFVVELETVGVISGDKENYLKGKGISWSKNPNKKTSLVAETGLVIVIGQ
ncbi:hypothetical protein [Pedosphaera parvula]|uniref:Uncharacterized protein n=1 Tax=Pedosphaera parvula (strain Ellin514) TaxID=320771 RepID=B9XP04_PEDPL|nr:hypothetical protein [Pedosphaera parvula]EEF58470.1 hypothetical protein Cflav_PD1093 [Pedosphaera parvula Ellin514]